MNSRMTVNFGIRWEPTFADPDKYGRGTSFNYAAFLAGQVSTVHPNAPAGLFFPGDKGIPAASGTATMANFAPRVGMVWNPNGDGKQTLRIGGSILYDVSETWFNERETTNAPVGTNIDTPNPVGGLSNPWQGYPGGNPFPQNGRRSSRPRVFTSICQSIRSRRTWRIGMSPTSAKLRAVGLLR